MPVHPLLVCALIGFSIAGASLAAPPRLSAAPERPVPDTLRLGALRIAAAEQDPRAVQPDLLARATRLRIAALRASRLPQFALSGDVTVQNEVAGIPLSLPDQDVPSPPHEQFQAQLEADWTLYDGGRTRRQVAVERAQLAENVAGVAVTLFALREAATEAFFGALLSEAQARTFALTVEDLEARLRVVRRQAEEGAALPTDAATLEAELIRTRQQVDEAAASRRASLDVLAALTGFSIDEAAVLALPDLDAEAARALRLLETEWLSVERPFEPGESFEDVLDDASLGRPELVRFVRTVERAEAEARARSAETRPSLSLFGQAGVGRPSPFDVFSDEASEFALGGVRLQWSLFDWGRARREAAALRLQARTAETEAAAFVRRIAREVEDEQADLARLDTALATDERAVALREDVVRVARRQLDEGVLLADTYTDRLTDLADARLTLEQHRIERAQAQARLLSTLGRYPEPSLIETAETDR